MGIVIAKIAAEAGSGLQRKKDRQTDRQTAGIDLLELCVWDACVDQRQIRASLPSDAKAISTPDPK